MANDLDTTGLSGATVAITGGFVAGIDTLTFTNGGGITGAWNSSTGVIEFNGNASFSQYQTVLNSVRFTASGDNPTQYGANTERTVSFTLFDGLAHSDVATATVTVQGTNDGPVNDNTPSSAPSGNEDAGAIAVVGLGVSDVDADPATQDIQLTLSVPSGTGVLTVSTSVGGGIQASDVTGNGTNSIVITATQNQINATLAAGSGLAFTPAANVNGTIALTMVTNDLGLNGTPGAISDTDTVNITVVAQNDTPDLANVGANGTSTEQIIGLLDINVTVSDVDLDPLNSGAGNYVGASLTIARQSGATAQDSFGLDTTGALFTVSGGNLQLGGSTFATFTSAGGTLTINFTSSGTAATGALVDDVLQHVTYQNTSDAPPANVTLSYAFNDGSPGNGQGGGAQAATDTGTITVSITAVNDAPVLDASKTPVINAVNEDAAAPSGAVGTLVSTLVDFSPPAGGLDNVTEPDALTLTGIALTGVNTTNGTWWYTLDGGATPWVAVPTLTDDAALLLAANGTTRLYFQPTTANFNGTINNAITFRAWDQSSGANGDFPVAPSPGGIATAFSSAADNAAITVTSVSDAPQGTDNVIVTIEHLHLHRR